MTIPLNDAAVAFIKQRGAPMTTANLNRAMNIVYAQRNGQSGDEQLPDTGNDASTRITKAIDRSLESPGTDNRTSTGPQNPVANTQSPSATPSQTGTTSISSMNTQDATRGAENDQHPEPDSDDRGGPRDGDADDAMSSGYNDKHTEQGGTVGDALAGGGVATSIALADRLSKFLADSDMPGIRTEPRFTQDKPKPGAGVIIEGSVPATTHGNAAMPEEGGAMLSAIRKLITHGR